MTIKKLRGIFASKILLSTLGTTFTLYSAGALAAIVEKATGGISSSLWLSVILLTVVSLFYFFVRGAFSYFLSKRETLVKQELKFSLYRQFFSLSPVNIYLHKDAGEVLETFRDDFNKMTGLWCDIIPSIIVSAVSYLVYLMYASSQSWQIGLLIFVLSQLQIIVPLVIEPKFYDNYAEDREWEAKTTNVEIEAHTAFRDIQIFGLHKWYAGYLDSFQRGEANVGKKYEYLCGMGTALETLVNTVIKYGTYAIIGVFMFAEQLSVGNAVLLLQLSGTAYSALMGVYEKIVDLSEHRAAKKRLIKMTESHIADTEKTLQYANSLRIDRCVVFADDEMILNVSACAIQEDRPNIIIGANGSGKSTLLKVLAGFIIPQDADITTKGDTSGVFYLPQEDMKLQETAIELVEPSKHDEYVHICTNCLGLSDEILNRPIKTLSGGECKKIYLALAFVEKEKFILLDEPTNHLDSAAKTMLAKLIEARKRRIVIVTHDDYFLKILAQMTDSTITHICGKESNFVHEKE